MLKVCLDTNVWISGLVYPTGKPAEIINLALNRKFQIVTSLFILNEVERNLTKKFDIDVKRVRRIIYRISQIADVYDPKGTLRVIEKHHADNFILETAWMGRAKYLVTGDKEHLLPLKIFKHIKIIEPAAFLLRLKN